MIDLTPLDVRKKRGDFKKIMRGYDPYEVDSFLELAAERLEAVVRENLQLRQRTDTLQERVDVQQEREQAVQDALVTAQELRTDIQAQSQREADHMLREADAEARRLLAEAKAEARRILSEAESEGRGRLRDVERRLDQSQDAVEQLEHRRSRFLREFRNLLERELETITSEEHKPSLAPDTASRHRHGGDPLPPPASATALEEYGLESGRSMEPEFPPEPDSISEVDSNPEADSISESDSISEVDSNLEVDSNPESDSPILAEVPDGDASGGIDTPPPVITSMDVGTATLAGASTGAGPTTHDAPLTDAGLSTETVRSTEAGAATDASSEVETAQDSPSSEVLPPPPAITLGRRPGAGEGPGDSPTVDVSVLQPTPSAAAAGPSAPRPAVPDVPSALEIELMAGASGSDGTGDELAATGAEQLPDLETLLAEAGLEQPMPKRGDISPPPAPGIREDKPILFKHDETDRGN
jgi:DivIVA domain-containing protein